MGAEKGRKLSIGGHRDYEWRGFAFDGRLWHGSRNTSKGRTRYALLLQYASANTPIRIPRFEWSEWPFEFLQSPRPPCILARGRASDLNVNRIVAPPTAFHNDRFHVISACAHQLQLPLEQDAVYIVFEFHRRHSTLPERQYQHTPKPSAGQRLIRVAKDPRRLVKAIARRAKRLMKR